MGWPVLAVWVVTVFACATAGCGGGAEAADVELSKRGTVEVTARLVEVPAGAIVRRELYDYAAVLKYEVVRVHRGDVAAGTVIYVAHYNPFKARAGAADKFVKDVGGNATGFGAGDVHHMALEADAEERFMGPMIDKYFDRPAGVTYWAVWTNTGSP